MAKEEIQKNDETTFVYGWRETAPEATDNITVCTCPYGSSRKHHYIEIFDDELGWGHKHSSLSSLQFASSCEHLSFGKLNQGDYVAGFLLFCAQIYLVNTCDITTSHVSVLNFYEIMMFFEHKKNKR